jgi:hypothetical protein
MFEDNVTIFSAPPGYSLCEPLVGNPDDGFIAFTLEAIVAWAAVPGYDSPSKEERPRRRFEGIAMIPLTARGWSKSPQRLERFLGPVVKSPDGTFIVAGKRFGDESRALEAINLRRAAFLKKADAA